MPEAGTDPALDLALRELAEGGLLQLEGGRLRTTPRWQAAMARAALRLQAAGAPAHDLRLPIAVALVELEGGLSDAALARRVEAMLPVEQAELGALFPAAPGDAGGQR